MLTTAILLTIPLIITQMRRRSYKLVTTTKPLPTTKLPTTTEWPYTKIEFPVIEYSEAEEEIYYHFHM